MDTSQTEKKKIRYAQIKGESHGGKLHDLFRFAEVHVKLEVRSEYHERVYTEILSMGYPSKLSSDSTCPMLSCC